MMLAALALLVGTAAVDTVPLGSGFEVEERVTPAAVIVHTQPAIPIVALRMSLLVHDPEGYAGAGHLFQHLHFPRLRDQVRRVGGHVQMQRNVDAIVYTVTGPAAELEYLGGVLKSALVAPAVSPGEMVAVTRELREERLAEWETAERHVRAQLRSRLFPADLPAAGTDAAAERIDIPLLRSLWGELYQPERISVVAVGDVDLDDVRQVFADLPGPPGDRLRRTFTDTVPATGLAPAEATRGWLGLGYSAAGIDPVGLTVTARLLGDALREQLPTARVQAEHWWTHQGQALAVSIAVPEAQLAAARRDLGAALATVQRNLSETAVRDAATAVRREMLFYSRTPERMAELVGSFADRDGDPNASQRFFSDLGRVGVRDIERVLDQLAARTPVRVDIPPQQLQTS
jgi:predicted Zn-dependent peptidase